MLYNFPSNFVFYTKVKDHEQLKKKLLPQIYANESGITYKGEYQDSITNRKKRKLFDNETTKFIFKDSFEHT